MKFIDYLQSLGPLDKELTPVERSKLAEVVEKLKGIEYDTISLLPKHGRDMVAWTRPMIFTAYYHPKKDELELNNGRLVLRLVKPRFGGGEAFKFRLDFKEPVRKL